MSPPLLSPLVAAIIGGVVAALVTQGFQLLHSKQAHRRAIELAKKADERALRDRKADRVRDLFIDALDAATTICTIANAKRFSFRGETDQQRAERDASALLKAREKLAAATASLRVISAANEIVDVFQEIVDTARGIDIDIDLMRSQPGTIDFKDLLGQGEQCSALVKRLRTLIQAETDRGESPL